MKIVKIKNIKKIDRTDRYDLTVPTTSNFFANGILIHNTSAIAGKILTNRKLSAFEKIAVKFGVSVKTMEYGLIYSSRGVVKNKFHDVDEMTVGTIVKCFACDILAMPRNIIKNRDVKSVTYPFTAAVSDYKKMSALKEKAPEMQERDVWYTTAQDLKDLIPNGMTLYYEIVGHTPGGKEIQKGYHYGAEPKKTIVKVYRITQVNSAGQFFELSYGQIKDFCTKVGVGYVDQFYYGPAKDCFPDIVVDDQWSDNFVARITKSFNLEQMCPFNGNKVPAEGVVVRVDNLFKFNAFKVKAFKFLLGESKALDTGEVDIETEQTLEH